MENGKTENDLFSILVNIQKDLILGISNEHSQADNIYWLFYNICPKLELYGAARGEDYPNCSVKRFLISDTGKDLLKSHYVNKLKKTILVEPFSQVSHLRYPHLELPNEICKHI